MRRHVDQMQKHEEDRLYHDESFDPILVHLIVYLLGLYVDDVTEPIKYSKYYTPPNEELTEECHFLLSVI